MFNISIPQTITILLTIALIVWLISASCIITAKFKAAVFCAGVSLGILIGIIILRILA